MQPKLLPRRRVVGALAASAFLPAAWAAGRELVRLPQHTTMRDPQLSYVQALVALALDKVGIPHEIQLIPLEMQQGRSLLELAAGRSPFDMMWTLTDAAREASGAIPIRIPIDRGLMGWRLPLVRKADLASWAEVRSLADLRRRVAGQGHDWPDTAILRANDLPVVTSLSYPTMFRMLAAGRFDYFPRSILEIDAELANDQHPELAIAPNLMLRYPAAAYLFLAPQRHALAASLTQGLEAAIADGSMQRLHREHYGAVVRNHPVPASRVLQLSNPLLPPLTPVSRPELWLQPGQA
jgi:hypothetical protein